MVQNIEKEEIRKVVHEVLYDDFIGDKSKFLNILDRLARLEEGQERILQMMDRRFEDINHRFEDINRRFEDMQKYMDSRFEDINRRFEDVNKRFTMLTTFMATGFSGLAILIALLKIFA